MRVAVLGAGLTGLIAAHELGASGCRVTVFDKARSCGGRMTTKAGPCGTLDIGAQYFTARSDAFVQQVDQWLAAGIAARWQFTPCKLRDGALQASPDDTLRYAGMGGMGAITDALAQGLDLRCSHRASDLQRTQDGWQIHWSRGTSGSGEERFDWLLLTLPLEQVQELAGPDLLSGFGLPPRIHVPCHAVGIATNGHVAPHVCGIFGDDEVSWVSRQSAKPGCAAPTGADDSWMVHFSPAWTARTGREPGFDLATRARDWLARVSGADLRLTASQAHYWAYANLDPDACCRGPFVDAGHGLAVAGAWCAGGRVEGAFTSARETCTSMLAG